MRYTVNEAIKRLQELVKKNPKIGDAKLCISTNTPDEIDISCVSSSYDLDISEDCLCDDTFFISEVDDREYDEDE